jgi:hypothetical protein
MSKSNEIKKNDGRKYNKRLAPKPISSSNKLGPRKRTTKAKKERISSYAINAMKEVFGGEKEAFVHMAELSKKNFNQMQLLMQYAYGKPSDKIDGGSSTSTKSTPVINFVMNGDVNPQIQEHTIDIDEEE